MNRTILPVAALFSASSLLVDSAVKGTTLLMLAAVAAMILRRDSAATRHLVWLLAIVAMLVVPVLSAMLPQWRVLPKWAGIPRETAVAYSSRPSIAKPTDRSVELPRNSEPVEVELLSAPLHQPVAELPDSRPALATPEIIREPADWNWLSALPLVWAVGFCALILRLMAARLLFWNTGRQAKIFCSSQQHAKATHDPIVTVLGAACVQLGICRPVTLLIHPEKTIPVVWGILRHHLLLPAAARHWSDEQLRSVLLHELAHIQRRDTLAQLLAQIACALHWFNPLVWFAAWRLGVERERACDDLVLASGVRPSAYAGHLLDVVTGLSPARWTQSCGLAMARQSSLEGRLVAVLSENLNRRGVSVAFAAIALAIAVGIAVPIAMLGAADEKPSAPVQQQESQKPKGKEAQSLFKQWQDGARADGKIPGGALGSLARAGANFVKFNPTDERAPKIAELLKQIDMSRDWTQAEAAALLDDVTAIYASLPSWAEDEPRFSLGGAVQTGRPLPAELGNAPWGEAQPNGLRVAWLLDPSAEQHRLGTPLKSRILFHNVGKNVVVFRALTWNQSGAHKARDAKGADINIFSVEWTTIPRIVACRLAPGEFMEVTAAGIGVGAKENDEDWQNTRVGSWVKAKEGDAVTFTPAPVSATGNFTDELAKGEPGWWLDFIKDRLSRDMPLPADAAERARLLDRAVRDLFGTAPTPEETAAFVADRAPDAFDALAKRLAQRAGTSSFTGTRQSGATKFRVLPVDPDAATKSRTANGPGQYELGGNATFVVTSRGEQRVNEAHIRFTSSEETKPVAPHVVKLPDGYNTWAAAWERGEGVLWVAEKGHVRSYRFANPAKVVEARFEPGSIIDAPFYVIGWQSDKSVLWMTQRGVVRTYDFADPLQRKDSRYESRARFQIPEEFCGAQAPAPAAKPATAATPPADTEPFAAPADPVQLAAALKTAHRLRVFDASGTKPLREFRVIAGVRSSVSQQFEKARGTRVAAWQSHTIHAGRDGVMLWPLDKSYEEMLLRVEADGCVPQLTDWIKKGDGPQDLTIKMADDPGVVGVATLPQGGPAAGATVVLAMAMRDAVLEGDAAKLRRADDAEPKALSDRWRQPRIFTADENGRFTLPTEPDSTAAVLIVHRDAVLELRYADFQKAPQVTLQKWGRLDGRVRWGDKSGAGESVDLIIHRDSYGYPGVIAQYAKSKTNADGQFVFEKVLPGLVQISVPITFAEPRKDGVSSVNLPGRLAHVTAQAGEPTPVLLGGRGRTVRGRLVGRDAWDGVTFHFHPTAPHFGRPGDDAMWSAWTQFQKSESGPVFFRNGLKVAADGSFEIPKVLPGRYQIFFSSADGKALVATGGFTVPAEDHDAAPEPQDAGEFRARQ